MKALIIGSDHRLGLELAANLQGRDFPFASVASTDASIDGGKALDQLLAAHAATHVVNVLSQEWFRSTDVGLQRRGLLLVKHLCRACRASGAALIHLSDDSMFAGRKSGAYREKDRPDRGDEHAKLALKGESHVIKRLPRHIVLRSGPVFAPTGENLLTRVMTRLETTGRLECTDDKICPTPANDVARVVVAIILQLSSGAEPWGIYHYCSSDASSFYNFAEAVVALASQYGRIRRDGAILLPRASQERNIILNCHQILGAFGIKQRPWRAALPSVVAEYCR